MFRQLWRRTTRRASPYLHATRAFLTDPRVVFTGNVLAWIPVGIFFVRHVYSMSQITGRSMLPTFNKDQERTGWKDHVLLDRWSWSWGRWALQRGDVVTLWSPRDPKVLTTKRIVALEGDIVTPRDPGPPKLTRAGSTPPDLTPYRIPPGHVWVEGDNAAESIDSNTYGPVAVGLVQARVTRILLPLDRSGPPIAGPPDDGRIKIWDNYTASASTQGAARPT
ncbi:hypothetical protein Q8F55_001439 [Vanrija albida]|uniref:Mitochondrial inner membrane protease subunit n=1 Tax=Vanrija albida TaxID=181172 RepID=A0ABR3QG78_9TREE